jgi:hypothetical protein
MTLEPISTGAWRRAGRDGRALLASVERGENRRLRHGVFADGTAWAAASSDDRYLAQIRAVSMAARGSVIFSHESAARLHGLPRIGRWPDVVDVAITRGGARATPGIHRRRLALSDQDVVVVHGMRCTSLARTVLDLAATRTFANAVVAGDRAVEGGLDVAEVLELLARSPTMRGAGRVRVVAPFLVATRWPIESASRANIHLLGLPAPVLQHPLYDENGLIGVSDFWFPGVRAVGECDGRWKYLDPAYRGGRSADQVVYDEKVREDRMRAVASGFARWDWRTATTPALLRVRLARAGVVC